MHRTSLVHMQQQPPQRLGSSPAPLPRLHRSEAGFPLLYLSSFFDLDSLLDEQARADERISNLTQWTGVSGSFTMQTNE